jgi:hypothetical protein
MATLNSFQKEIEASTGKELRLEINDNYSTMLSVKWEPDCTKVSMHRMFLGAPANVMEELACYLRQEKRSLTPTVKAFIQNNITKLDYSHLLKRQKLETAGTTYNLQKIYNALNKEYFDQELNLNITWYGNAKQRARSKITFGQYQDPLRLIKIHRMLDHPSFPDYLVEFVVYHEMLHHVSPSYVDKKGMHHIHSKEFKQLEKKFKKYALAQLWIKENQADLFD